MICIDCKKCPFHWEYPWDKPNEDIVDAGCDLDIDSEHIAWKYRWLHFICYSPRPVKRIAYRIFAKWQRHKWWKEIEREWRI